MLNIAICEDNAEDMLRLRRLLEQTEVPSKVTGYTTAEGLLEDLERGGCRYDLYFLDILLPGQNGAEIARRLRFWQDAALVVFLTVSEEYYREAFDVYAFQYLLKPITLPALRTVLQNAARVLKKQAALYFPITTGGRDIRLRQSDIKCIASSNHRLHIHLADGQEYTIYSKLDDVEKKLSSPPFVRCHKSYLVNLDHVDRLTPEGFYIGKDLISISRAYAAQAKAAYHNHLFSIFENV